MAVTLSVQPGTVRSEQERQRVGTGRTNEIGAYEKDFTTPAQTVPKDETKPTDETKPRYYTQQTTASPANYDRTVPTVSADAELQSQYQAAMAALEQMKGEKPTYGSQYDAQIQSLYEQIMGRGSFKYDSKTDPLYQQYVQDYTQQGQMAMRDTMGRAAGLTGGYGSSYAQAVGQQQYDQYLQKMADILPETYGMALDAYNAEGDQLNSKLATTTSLEQSDYGRYLDALNQHNIDIQRAQTDADTWYDRMLYSENQNYARQQDNYNRLVSLISMGYTPSKSDYAAAGLSQAQGEALRGTYKPKPVYITRTAGNNAGNQTGLENFSKLLDDYFKTKD